MSSKRANYEEQNLAVLKALLKSTTAAGGTGLDSLSMPNLPKELQEVMARGVKDGLRDYVDPAALAGLQFHHYIRHFCSSVPFPFRAFEGIRKSLHTVKLEDAQEETVMKAFDKLCKGADGGPSTRLSKDISVPVPFVSAFFDKHCKELGSSGLSSPRSGATYLLLSVITGHKELCLRCLKAGANPNNLSFLKDENPSGSEMFHGYSPMFMAVLAEQIEIMDLLSSYGGSVHVCDRWGRTPLHAAAALNSLEVVQWLLAKGAPRYVGDCFNLTPAESSEDDYFPELVMPLLAIQGPRTRPTLEYLREVEKNLSTVPTDDETAVDGAASKQSRKPTTAPSASTEDAPTPAGSSADVTLCHCHSGRPAGFCGCVDDMYVRWSVDRLAQAWSPSVDFLSLSKRQMEAEEKLRNELAQRRRRA